jgi:hypothetical protein
MLAWLEGLTGTGFLSSGSLDALTRTTTAGAALEAVAATADALPRP